MNVNVTREVGAAFYLGWGLVVALLVCVLFAIRRTAWYRAYRRSVDDDFEG